MFHLLNLAWFQPSFAGTETLGSSFELLLVDIRVHSGQNLLSIKIDIDIHISYVYIYI